MTQTSTDILYSKMFSTLVTIPINTACLPFLNYILHFLMVYSLSFLVLKLGGGPLHSHRR